MAEFKDRLAYLRSKAGITQAVLAKALHVSNGTIGNYESGARVPKLDDMLEIADYFNVTLDFLAGKEDKLDEYNLEERLLIRHFRAASEKDKRTAKTALGFYDEEIARKCQEELLDQKDAVS